MAEYTLIHSGTKDMHWYHRRYRNYDGTLTPEGKERYNYYQKKTDRVYNTARAKQTGPKVYKPTRYWGEQEEDLSRFTNEELKVLTYRAKLEKEYRKAFNTRQYTKGRKFLEGMKNSGKQLSEIIGIGAQLIENVNKMSKALNDNAKGGGNGGKNVKKGPKTKKH